MTRSMQVNFSSKTYDLQHDWPLDCKVQGGESGIVFTKPGALKEALADPVKAGEMVVGIVAKEVRQPHYRTAYFEAFPESNGHGTFLRGEGKSLQEAEDKAWRQWVRVRDCEHKEFEARRYENGAGFCKACGMFASNVIPPVHPCATCGAKTWHSEHDGKWGCDKHPETSPEMRKLMEEAKKLGWNVKA